MSFQTISRTSSPGSYLSNEQMLEVIDEACPTSEYREKSALDCPGCDSNLPLGNAFQRYLRANRYAGVGPRRRDRAGHPPADGRVRDLPSTGD